MIKATCTVAALALALTSILSPDAAAAQPRTARGELVHAIVTKWGGHVQEAYKSDVGAWARAMGPQFAKSDLAALQRAADADGFDAMNAALTGVDAGAKGGMVAPRALGEAATDLVFVPVAPCRLFDTRLAGGLIAANTVRDFDVTAVSSYSFQGGANNDCGGVGLAGSFAAAVVNLTVVSPSGAGYITAFPFGGSQPVAATVNYAAGAIVGNLAVVKLDQGASANEMSVYSYAGTHLVGDIVGYYINPAPTPLQCQTLQTSYSIAAGASFNGGSPTCTTGYTRTGGGCFSASYSGRVVSTYPNGTTHFCSWVNEGGTAMNGVAMVDCCRVPGR